MRVAIITEGLQCTGYGHITRCHSIYQAFEEKNITPIFIANCDEKGKVYLCGVNLWQLDWINETDALINKIKSFDYAIIDSYLAPLPIYKKIKNCVRKAVFLDDYMRLDYPAGIIINGTIGAEKIKYKNSNRSVLLLGSNYISLRKEFWNIDHTQNIDPIKKLLIIFGGQDNRSMVIKTLDIVQNTYPDITIYAITGNNSNINTYQYNNVFFYNSLTSEQIIDMMKNINIAITGAGQTTYELNAMKVPFIAIGVAENQKNNLKGWYEKKVIEKILWYDDPDLENNIVELLNYYRTTNPKIESFVDGVGARRVVSKLLNI